MAVPSQRSRQRRPSGRGVTLIEMMVVIVIIGMFVAMAAPVLGSALSDRHVERATNRTSGVFRTARTRSAATGAAHLVRTSTSGSSIRFEVRAAVSPTTGAAVSSCTQPTWGGTSTDNQLIDVLDPATDTSFSSNGVQILAVAGATGTIGDFCFTPQGTAWWNTTGVWRQASVSDYLKFLVQRTDGKGAQRGMQRVVTIGAMGSPKVTSL